MMELNSNKSGVIMMRYLQIGLLLLVSVSLCYPQQTGSAIQERIRQFKEQQGDKLLRTAEEVIARHVEAVGGRDAILAVKTLRFTGRQMGEDRTLYRHYKQPNLIRSTWSLKGERYTLSDGEKVWSVTPEGRQELDAWWAISFSHSRIDGNFIDYKKRGIQYEYIGLAGFETDRKIYYHLRRTFPDGFIEELYFEVETGLLRGLWRTSSPRKDDPIFYYDYRKVGGIRIPHMWVGVFDKASPPHVLVIDEIIINEDFGEDFFTGCKAKPVKK
jgi:hypothetical protein